MILYITTADTDILTLQTAAGLLPQGFEQVRAANVTDWAEDEQETYAFLDRYLPEARLVVMRLLGGRRAHPAAFDHVVQHCHAKEVPLLVWPGDQEPYLELVEATNVSAVMSNKAMLYAAYGGVENFTQLFRFLSDTFLQTDYGYCEPAPLPWSGIYWPGLLEPLDVKAWQEASAKAVCSKSLISKEKGGAECFTSEDRAVVGILFYRAHWMSRNLDFIDALVQELEKEGCRPLPVFTQSLKEDHVFRYLYDEAGKPLVDALVVTMSFAVHARGEEVAPSVREGRSRLEQLDVPVFQAIVSLHARSAWEASEAGISPLDIAMNVAMPEFDGRIITVPFCFKEKLKEDVMLKTAVRRYVAVADRTSYLARLVSRWAALRKKPASEKKLAFLLTNYPSKNSRIGNAVGLDTPQSVVHILHALLEEGYDLGDPEALPRDGDELVHALIDRCSNDREMLTQGQLALAAGHLSEEVYEKRWQDVPLHAQAQMEKTWGPPPGEVFLYQHQLVIPGISFGNIFVGLQPPRGFGDNPVAVYHSPDLVPTHHYVGYYYWMKSVFQADAVIHVGKHGTLEWLPGKGIGLSQACFPEVVLDDLPHFYPYIVNNPGEGTQAKRRSHATIVDHLVPVMTDAEVYDDLARLEQLLDEYYQVQTLDPKKLPLIEQEIWQTVVRAQLHRDLHQEGRPEDFNRFLQEVDGYLCELKAAQIRDGLHVLGQLPEHLTQWVDLLYALLQLSSGPIRGLPEAVAADMGVDWQVLQRDLGRWWEGELPPLIKEQLGGRAQCVVGEVREAIVRLARHALEVLVKREDFSSEQFSSEKSPVAEISPMLTVNGEGRMQVQPGENPGYGPESRKVLDYAARVLIPRLKRTPEEIKNLLHGISGGFVPPGPSGAPTRGMSDILPTGRNFYSVDPAALPSPAAWQVGQQLAQELVGRYLKEEGAYPESVGIVVWGTAAMRTRGDDIAEILALLGVRPVWQAESRRVTGLEVIPLEALGRPRVDVTVRISGFFRDAFPNLVRLVNQAVEMVGELDEPFSQNPVRKHILTEAGEKQRNGNSAQEALETSRYRVFGSKPGTYGSGLLPLIEGQNWQDDADLARVYTTWSGYAYTREHFGLPAAAEFQNRLSQVQVATKNQDNREHDIFDSDDYFQEHGGMVATIRALTGRNPAMYFGDSANPGQVRVRPLSEEAMRVFRSRVVNPKWIASVVRHGYKGAMEMANTVDFLFGYDATAHVMEDWMYDKLARTYLLDEQMQSFFQKSNPWAMKDMTERLLEAAQRGLWQVPDPEVIASLAEMLLQAEAWIEEGMAQGMAEKNYGQDCPKKD